MVLRLYVWGPAFGLASIDAECLATITYLAQAVPRSEWTLTASSPSGVPTHSLPALHDSDSGAWTSGFAGIVSFLSSQNPQWDLDKRLSAAQTADLHAYSTFLAANATPLIALSLYVSSANWAAATRPAYSAVLPFPLTWTEPLTIRKAMSERAEHLGLSDLDTDVDPASDGAPNPADGGAAGSTGFLKIPASLRLPKRGVMAAMSPEQTAQIRLDAVARDCLAVLADLLGNKRFFLTNSKPTALDCLAFGYLALMLVPKVPRPWLQDSMRRRFESLCYFVDRIRDDCFGGDVLDSLPWQEPDARSMARHTVLGIGARFIRGVARAQPGVGGDWRRSVTVGPADDDDEGKPWQQGVHDRGSLLAALGGGVASLSVVGAVLLYRHLSPFGAALYRWERQRRAGLGAAGAFFGL